MQVLEEDEIMKKYLIVLGLVFLLLCIVFSGCTQINDVLNDSNDNDDSDKIEIISHSVKTRWSTWDGTLGIQYHEQDGFVDLPSDAQQYSGTYIITGTVKNIADKPIDSCTITATFYDGSGNILDTDSGGVTDLYLNESKDFDIWADSYLFDYFEHVEEYTLSVSVTLH